VKRLTVATTNPGKAHEIRMALADLREWEIESLPAGTPAIDETGTTFLENAVLKATHYSERIEGLVLADDSGLCVKALDDRPGVWSARYGATAEDRNLRVLQELDELKNRPPRDAVFHCVFAVARAGALIWSTDAELEGEIALEPTGTGGFGFDPIFFVPELRKTLAQLTAEEKNRVSARGEALVALKRFLTTR
jgi:non-canonical purine NTP pyrophosphatase (RdgB/HAM1 family)